MAEQAFPGQPIGPSAGRGRAPADAFYTTGEDNLRITSINSVSGVVLAIRGRFIDARGRILAGGWTHTPTSDRVSKTETFALAEGGVLNLTVLVTSGSPQIDQTFVIVQLVRGVGSAAIVLATLLAGSVTTVQSLGWPGSPIANTLAGEGALRFITGTDPAANTDIIETVPTGARWELLSIVAQLTTDATVGNRGARLLIDDGIDTGNPYFYSGQITTTAASLTTIYTWAQGMPLVVAPNGGNIAGLEQPCYLLAGHRIRIQRTGTIGVGDNWNAPRYWLREWLTAN